MADISIITEKIIFLGIFALIGFVSTFLRYTKPTLSEGISTTLTRLTIPALVISSFSTLDMDAQRLKNGLLMLIISYLLIFFLIFLGKLCAKFLGLRGVTASAHTYLTACGNVTFMGYPIITAILGTEGLYYAMLYVLANDTVIWVLSVYSIAKCTGKKHENMLKKLLNPSTISLLLGFLVMLFNVKFPPAILSPMQTLGACTIPLSMIFIGITLATIKFSKLLNCLKGFVIVLVKMLLVPGVLISLMPLFDSFGIISATGIVVLILQCAMPSTSIYAVLSKTYGGDPEYAAQNIMITTGMSFFTIPFIYYLITNFNGIGL